MIIDDAVKIIASGEDLTAQHMAGAMEEIMGGKAVTSQIVSFLAGLSAKGETVEELTAAVSVMRQHVVRIHTDKPVVLDTCGTGGDVKGTFNISTAASFVAAGAGITVAKHGNRSISSSCGSADILEALGININMSPKRLEECLDKVGIAFLFAPNLHPAMRFAMPARKEIGKRTMFNILGPLTNPAQAQHQLIGVYDQRWTEILAQVLLNLGTNHALIVHGEDGMDEITTTGATFIAETDKEKVKTYKITPEDFSLQRASLDELKGGTANDNAKILLDILNGFDGRRRDIVILNAAAAIYAADGITLIKDAIAVARESLDSKMALKKFNQLKEFSNQ